MIPFWTQQGTVDLAALRPEDMTAEIIGDTLAKINRFGGRTEDVISVAAHSVLVESLVSDELKPWALLHDAHEAFIGDLTTPAVAYIASKSGFPEGVKDALDRAKTTIDQAIGAAWRTAVRSRKGELRKADRLACHVEAYCQLGVIPLASSGIDRGAFQRALRAYLTLPVCCDWKIARDLWRERVDDHARQGRLTPPKAPTPARISPAG